MPKFTKPEIPVSINVSLWDKKRELFSKKKPSGVSAAIKLLLDIYKKTDWSPLERVGELKFDGTIRNWQACKEFNNEITKKKAELQNIKSALHASYEILRKATLALHKTAKEASVMFAKENYPKASKAAVEIATDAIIFAGYLNPASLDAFVDKCYKDAIADANKTIKFYLTATDLHKAIAMQKTCLDGVRKQATPELRAKMYNALGDDKRCRTVSTSIAARLKAACMGCVYPVSVAKPILDAIDPYANKHVAATSETVDDTLGKLDILFTKASSLPADVAYLK